IAAVKNDAARLALAQLAYDRKHFATAAGLWAAALANDPKLADDRQRQHRYSAARAAAAAAGGQAYAEPALDDAAKADLRRHALEWLKAELTVWRDLYTTDADRHRSATLQTLSLWRQAPELIGIRDPGVLAMLPAEQQPALTQ